MCEAARARRERAGIARSPDGARVAFTAADTNGIGEVKTIGKGQTQMTPSLGAVGDLSRRSEERSL